MGGWDRAQWMGHVFGVALLAFAFVLGCSGTRGPSPGCIQGLVQRCVCNGGMGTRICRIDGTFGACSCDAPVTCPASSCTTQCGGKACAGSGGSSDAGRQPTRDAGAAKPGKDNDAGSSVQDSGTRRDTGRAGGGGSTGPSCASGAQRCNANNVETCSQLGVFTPLRSCGPLICAVESGSATCREPCTPGQATCMGAKLRACRPDGLGFTEKTCDLKNGLYCDGASAKCVFGCVPGTTKCDGPQSLVCRDDAIGFDPQQRCMGATPGCSPATGRCSLPCATGTVEESFSNGMVGCAQQVAHDSMLAQRCSFGFHVCTAVEWVASSGGKIPTSDYWFAESIHTYDGSDGHCSIDSGTQNLGGAFKICTKTVGDCTTLAGCGYQTTTDQSFGYSARDAQAGALCCPD